MPGPESLTLRLKHAEQAVRRTLEHLLALEDLTFEQWQVLAAILEQPGLRMTDLAELACLPPATLTRHVDHLVGLALVIRRIDPADRRRAVVALSARGQRLAQALGALESDVDLRAGSADLTGPRLSSPALPRS